MDKKTANKIIDLQAEITALRGAVRMLLHNVYNANDSALAVLREKAFQADKFLMTTTSQTNAPHGIVMACAKLLPVFLTHSSPTMTRQVAWPILRRGAHGPPTKSLPTRTFPDRIWTPVSLLRR